MLDLNKCMHFPGFKVKAAHQRTATQLKQSCHLKPFIINIGSVIFLFYHSGKGTHKHVCAAVTANFEVKLQREEGHMLLTTTARHEIAVSVSSHCYCTHGANGRVNSPLVQEIQMESIKAQSTGNSLPQQIGDRGRVECTDSEDGQPQCWRPRKHGQACRRAAFHVEGWGNDYNRDATSKWLSNSKHKGLSVVDTLIYRAQAGWGGVTPL